MAQVILLGTGAALSDETREHTYLVVQSDKSAVLIDCAGSPVQRLAKAGVELDSIDHVVLTHHHPDHIYGLPILLLDLWLAGREKVLCIYGLPETLRAVRAILHAFEWERWFDHGFFPVLFNRISKRQRGALFVTPDLAIFTAPTQHLLPSVAVRVLSGESGRSIVYSSDTQACDAVVELARGAEVLFHEATTRAKPSLGHSSARQAGAQAARAGANKLVLVHLPPNLDAEAFRAAAATRFAGRVVVGRDFARFSF